MKQIQGIWLPDDDDHFGNHLEKGHIYAGKGTYQFNKLKIAVELCGKERRGVAVDVGAHVGTWSRCLAKMFDTVVSFEPLTKNYECLLKNVEDHKNVVTYQKGLADKEGVLTFNPINGNTGNGCVCEPGAPGCEDIEVITLDDLSYASLDLLKIDVEGYEMPVLIGATQTILRCKPVIVLEQKPGNAEKYGLGQFTALEYLKNLGMKVKKVKAGDYFLTF